MLRMKLKYFIFIMCLNFLISNSTGKLIFHREEESNVDVLKYFFEENFFNSSNFHLVIIPLNFAKFNPYAFTNLMINLNHYSRNSLMVLDNTTIDNVITGENFLLLQFGAKIDPLLTALDSIGKDTKFSFRRVLVWFEGIELKKTRSIIKIKTGIININEAIVLSPILISNGSKGMQESIDGIRLSVRNVLLSKKNSVIISKVGYNTNKTIIRKTLIHAKKQLGVFTEKLQKEAWHVLLFLRPLSVDKYIQDKKTSYRGIDISLLKAISNNLNVTYHLTEGMPSEYGTVYKNGTYTRAFRDTLNRLTDLCINRFPVDESEPGIVAFPFDRDKFCFIVRTPKLRVRPWSIFMSFRTSVWFTILGIYIGIYIFFLFVREPNWKSITFIESILSSPQLQVTQDSRRVFWGFWLLFVVMITDIFISLFVTQLLPQKNPTTYHSIKRLIELNFTLLTEMGHFKIFHPDLINRTLTPYYGRAQDIDDNTALLTSELTRIKLKYMFATDFEVVSECLRERFVGPLMSTSHTMFSSTDIMINRIISSGQLIFWVKNYLNTQVHLLKNVTKNCIDRSYDAPINIVEIEFIFQYTGIGLLTSMVVFIGELLYFKINMLVKGKVQKPRLDVIRVHTYTD